MATEAVVWDGNVSATYTVPQDCTLVGFAGFRALVTLDQSQDWGLFTNGSNKFYSVLAMSMAENSQASPVMNLNYPLKAGTQLYLRQYAADMAILYFDIPSAEMA